MDSVLHLLGIARKGGRVAVGEEPVGACCRERKAQLVLLASDAAANTVRRAAHFGEAGKVLWLTTPYDKGELGLAVGRTSCAMVAVTDAGLAAALVAGLAKRDPEQYSPAAEQLRQKAEKVLQRQREQRQHERNLARGKGKPWVPPPPEGGDCRRAAGPRRRKERNLQKGKKHPWAVTPPEQKERSR